MGHLRRQDFVQCAQETPGFDITTERDEYFEPGFDITAERDEYFEPGFDITAERDEYFAMRMLRAELR